MLLRQARLKAASDPRDFQSCLRTLSSEMHTLQRLRKTPGVSIFTVTPTLQFRKYQPECGRGVRLLAKQRAFEE